MGKRKKQSIPGCPFWMVTLGDVSALMLTFFVMLLSFSSFEEEGQQKIFGAMDAGFGMIRERQKPPPKSDYKAPRNFRNRRSGNAPGDSAEKEEGETLYKPSIRNRFTEQKQTLESSDGQKNITYKLLKDGVHIYIPRRHLFDGVEQLKDKASEELLGAANLAVNLSTEIRIVEHMSIAGNGGNEDAKIWGQALKRTVRLGKYMQKTFGFSKDRFGYGLEVQKAGEGEQDVMEIILLDDIETRKIEIDQLLKKLG